VLLGKYILMLCRNAVGSYSGRGSLVLPSVRDYLPDECYVPEETPNFTVGILSTGHTKKSAT
jgi:hypothetical protein